MQSRFFVKQISLPFERCECIRREVSGNCIVDVLLGSPITAMPEMLAAKGVLPVITCLPTSSSPRAIAAL